MKPTLTQEQFDLVETTLQGLENTAELFDMSLFVQDGPCGTVCCFAGELAGHVAGEEPDVNHESVPVADNQGDFYPEWVRVVAAKALGLIDPYGTESRSLFFTSAWPAEFRLLYNSSMKPKRRVAALRARVQHWMETGE